jgi:DnaJ-class molecular chaperone
MNGDTFRPPGVDALALLGADEAGHASHSDCFADEVVIDFPSVAPVVEKMRHAFVESERCTPLCARVKLSLRQAACGVRLPLEVPVRTTCRTCGGRGETWSEPCTRCGASGTEVLRHQVQVSVPPGVADGARYRFSVATRHDPPTHVELQVTVQGL